MKKKTFIVGRMSEPDEHGVISYQIVAVDGECWQFSLHEANNEFQLGEQIGVYMKMAATSPPHSTGYIPDFDVMGAFNAIKIDLAKPLEVVAELWGEAVAKENVPPEKWRFDPLGFRPLFRFEPSHFVNSTIATAEKKATIANKFVKFISRGFLAEDFTAGLMKYILLCFPFDNVSNPVEQLAFYNHWFADIGRKRLFLTVIAESEMAGDPNLTLADLHRLLKAWVIQKALPRWERTFKTATALQEREELVRLLSVYGMPEQLKLPDQVAR